MIGAAPLAKQLARSTNWSLEAPMDPPVLQLQNDGTVAVQSHGQHEPAKRWAFQLQCNILCCSWGGHQVEDLLEQGRQVHQGSVVVKYIETCTGP